MSEPIKTLPLVFDEPRGRKKPPRHLADLSPEERKALLVEAGLPGLPGQAAVHALLLPARRRPRPDDRPARRRPRSPCPAATCSSYLYDEQVAAGQGELNYPPDYPKMPGEPPRVQPSKKVAEHWDEQGNWVEKA